MSLLWTTGPSLINSPSFYDLWIGKCRTNTRTISPRMQRYLLLIQKKRSWSRLFLRSMCSHITGILWYGRNLVLLGLGLGLVFWLVLGFVLVVYSAGQKIKPIVGSFFWSYPAICFRALLNLSSKLSDSPMTVSFNARNKSTGLFITLASHRTSLRGPSMTSYGDSGPTGSLVFWCTLKGTKSSG